MPFCAVVVSTSSETRHLPAMHSAMSPGFGGTHVVASHTSPVAGAHADRTVPAAPALAPAAPAVSAPATPPVSVNPPEVPADPAPPLVPERPPSLRAPALLVASEFGAVPSFAPESYPPELRLAS